MRYYFDSSCKGTVHQDTHGMVLESEADAVEVAKAILEELGSRAEVTIRARKSIVGCLRAESLRKNPVRRPFEVV